MEACEDKEPKCWREVKKNSGQDVSVPSRNSPIDVHTQGFRLYFHMIQTQIALLNPNKDNGAHLFS